LAIFFAMSTSARVQKNVVGDEGLARAHDGCSGGGVKRRFAKVGQARGVGGDLVANALELAAANVFEVLPLGPRGGGFVEVDGNAVALPDLRAGVLGHGDAVFERDAVNGDERDHVGRAHAGMRALVPIQVDQLGGLAHAANGGFLNGLAVADQRDHAAVVVGVHLAVEQVDAGNLHGFDDGVDFGRVAAFREIGNAFNQRAGHGEKDSEGRCGRANAVSRAKVEMKSRARFMLDWMRCLGAVCRSAWQFGVGAGRANPPGAIVMVDEGRFRTVPDCGPALGAKV
jgi:hypothetical protein